MARIRSIKPEFFTDPDLYELESETGLPIRVAFAGLWCQADREGRFKWQPRVLKLGILPFDDVDFVAVLGALERAGLIHRYTVDDREYGEVRNFTRHQVINHREAPSVLPPCPTRPPRVPNAYPTRPGQDSGASQTEQGTVPGMPGGKGKEGKGKEGKGKELASPPADEPKAGTEVDTEPWWAERSETIGGVRVAVARRLPPDACLDDTLRADADGLGYPAGEVDALFAKFRDVMPNARPQTDWRARWRLFVREEPRFDRGGAGGAKPPERAGPKLRSAAELKAEEDARVAAGR